MSQNEKSSSGKRCGDKDHIRGIKCNVKNCVYHDCDTHCTAGEIAVGPGSASSSFETSCDTFKEKKETSM